MISEWTGAANRPEDAYGSQSISRNAYLGFHLQMARFYFMVVKYKLMNKTIM